MGGDGDEGKDGDQEGSVQVRGEHLVGPNPSYCVDDGAAISFAEVLLPC